MVNARDDRQATKRRSPGAALDAAAEAERAMREKVGQMAGAACLLREQLDQRIGRKSVPESVLTEPTLSGDAAADG